MKKYYSFHEFYVMLSGTVSEFIKEVQSWLLYERVTSLPAWLLNSKALAHKVTLR